MLSMADVEDVYEVTYVPKEKFIVHMEGRDLEFVRRNKMYVADMSDWIDYSVSIEKDYAFMTIQEREHLLTRKEKERALKAKEFVRVAGYPSEREAVSMIRDGNIDGMPHEVSDVKDYFDVYDVPIASVRGKWTHKKAAARLTADDGIREQRKEQKFTSDVLHINGESFLISVSSPLELTINSHLSGLSTEDVGAALQSQVRLIESRGYRCTYIMVDPQRSLVALQGKFPGITIDISGAGDHLPKVDAKIRRVKELYR